MRPVHGPQRTPNCASSRSLKSHVCVNLPWNLFLSLVYFVHDLEYFILTWWLPHKLERGGRKVGGGKSLNNFLRSSCFNIELSLPPRCLSISCIHFASYVDFPHWPLHHFLRFCCCNIRPSPASTTSCMHLVSISKFHTPCAIVSNKNHKQDNVSQFAGQLRELEGPRCLNRWTLGWGTLRVGIGL